MDASESKRVVLDFLDALRRGDREAARAAFDEQATWTYPASLGGPGVYRGRDAIFDAYFALDEDLYETGTRRYDIEVRRAVAEEDVVSVEMRHRGRTLDGRPYESEQCVVYELRDGRIHAVREYLDSLYAWRVLGRRSPG